jgi:hypothetical protein
VVVTITRTMSSSKNTNSIAEFSTELLDVYYGKQDSIIANEEPL